MKERIIITLVLLFTGFFCTAQETPPAGLKPVNAQLYLNLADSSIWHYKGNPYGWERIAKYNELSAALAGLTADNGLQKIDNNVQLGGTLNKNTVVSGTNDNGLTISNLTSGVGNSINVNSSGVSLLSGSIIGGGGYFTGTTTVPSGIGYGAISGYIKTVGGFKARALIINDTTATYMDGDGKPIRYAERYAITNPRDIIHKAYADSLYNNSLRLSGADNQIIGGNIRSDGFIRSQYYGNYSQLNGTVWETGNGNNINLFSGSGNNSVWYRANKQHRFYSGTLDNYLSVDSVNITRSLDGAKVLWDNAANANYVPYSGATSDLNIGNHDVITNGSIITSGVTGKHTVVNGLLKTDVTPSQLEVSQQAGNGTDATIYGWRNIAFTQLQGANTPGQTLRPTKLPLGSSSELYLPNINGSDTLVSKSSNSFIRNQSDEHQIANATINGRFRSENVSAYYTEINSEALVSRQSTSLYPYLTAGVFQGLAVFASPYIFTRLTDQGLTVGNSGSYGTVRAKSLSTIRDWYLPDKSGNLLVDADTVNFVRKSGSVMSGPLSLARDAVNAMEPVTKNQFDNYITGITWKQEVKVKTVSNIVLSGFQTIDDVQLTLNDRVLVASQTNAYDNGIYIVKSGSWARANDADAPSEIATAAVLVRLGSVNRNTQWTCTNITDPTIGTDAITFGQIAGVGTYTNGSYLTLNGNVFDANISALDSRYLQASAYNTLGDSRYLQTSAFNTLGDARYAQLNTPNTYLASQTFQRNSADAITDVIINKANSGASGNILALQFQGANKMQVDLNGNIGTIGRLSIGSTSVVGSQLYVIGGLSTASAFGVTAGNASAIGISNGTYTSTTSSGPISDAAINILGTPTMAATNTTSINNAYSLWVNGAPIAGTNTTISNRFAAGFNGNIDVRDIISQYNTADQVTNYERVRSFWNGNAYTIATENGGTGTQRDLILKGSATTLTLSAQGASNSALTIDRGNTAISNMMKVNSTYIGTGTQNVFTIGTTINQSGSANFRGLFISPNAQSLGSGFQYLIDAGLNTAAEANGTHNSVYRVDFSGNSTQKGSLQSSGRVAPPTGIKTISYNVTANDEIVPTNSTTAALNISLLATAPAGQIYTIDNSAATANAVTVIGTINGAANYTLNAGKYLTVYKADAATNSWRIIANN